MARSRADFDVAEQRLEQARSACGDSEALQLEWTLLRASANGANSMRWRPGFGFVSSKSTRKVAAILESLARGYMHEVRLRDALMCLDRWTELVPNCARAWDWRGWVYQRLGKPAAAQRDYAHAVELDPERDGARLRLARLNLEGREHENALTHVEQLLRRQPGRVEVQTLLARCRALEGKTEESREILKAALDHAPDDADVSLQLGKIEMVSGDLDQAEKSFRRAPKVDSYLGEARYSLSQCLRRQARDEEADRELALWKKKNEEGTRLTDLLARQGRLSPRGKLAK